MFCFFGFEEHVEFLVTAHCLISAIVLNFIIDALNQYFIIFSQLLSDVLQTNRFFIFPL